jgi:hypothetical protein
MAPAGRSRPAHRPVEMTADPLFAKRIRRLVSVSAAALGLVWLLWMTTLDTHPAIGAALAGGWFLMPVVLAMSLPRPSLRYALVAPSSLVGGALLTLCLTALPTQSLARAGWLLITAGVLFGGSLGAWFWFRWAPVPLQLDKPFSRGRWSLVGVHVALVVAGLALVGSAALV